MSDDHKYSDEEKNPKKGGEFRVPPRTWLVWIAIFGGIILLMLFKDRLDSQDKMLKQYQFQQLVESNQIAKAIINYSPQNPFLTEIVGKSSRPDAAETRVKTGNQDDKAPSPAKARQPPKLKKKTLSM